MGMAALLPGMKYFLERMQAELNNFELELEGLQNSQQPKKKIINSYWAKLTPEERSAEIIRRQKVAAKNRAKKAAA